MGRVWKVLVYAWIISWRTYLAEFVCFYSKAFRCTIAEKALRRGELETRVLALPLVHPISIGSSVNPLFGRIKRSGYALKKTILWNISPNHPSKQSWAVKSLLHQQNTWCLHLSSNRIVSCGISWITQPIHDDLSVFADLLVDNVVYDL